MPAVNVVPLVLVSTLILLVAYAFKGKPVPEAKPAAPAKKAVAKKAPAKKKSAKK